MENKLNESEDNKEEGEKGGKKEEVGDKRSPILGRQKKRFAKDDNKNNNNNNNNNKQEDTDDEIIPGTPQKIKPVRVVKKKYTDYSNHQWCSCSDFAQDFDCKYHNHNNKQDDTDDEIIPETPEKIKRQAPKVSMLPRPPRGTGS